MSLPYPLLLNQPLGYHSLRHMMVWEEMSFALPADATPETTAVTLTNFFHFAIQLTTAVYDTHRQQIQHLSLTPSSILIPTRPTTLTAQERTPIRLRYSPPGQPAPTRQVEWLAYIAPEQSGRMTYTPDHRTDLYALGVIFYQLLTGELPFTATDPVAIIHAHLAIVPAPPADCCPAIPRPLSDIIMKLLTKDRQRRYQSAAGLCRELETCLTLWQTTGNLDGFIAGAMDIPDQLVLPSAQYGRQTEWAQCQAAWATTVAGHTQQITLSGATGMGKSEWAHGLAPLIQKEGGLLLTYRAAPSGSAYTAVISLLNQFIYQLLGQPADELAIWRERWRPILRDKLPLLQPHLPYIDRLAIAADAPDTTTPPSEQGVLLQLALHDLLHTLFTASRPLLIFLDDAPNADRESRQLLHNLAAQPDLSLLLILTVNSDEPFPADWSADGLQITLPPLTATDISQLLADTLHTTPDARVAELGALLHRKTGGNPFFLRHYLTTLYTRGWLAFNPDAHQWEWDLGQISTHTVSDNVAEIARERLQFLPADVQKTLKIAAWLGYQFPSDWLTAVCEHPPALTDQHLQLALAKGLLVRLYDEGRPLVWVNREQEILQDSHTRAFAEIGQSLAAGDPPPTAVSDSKTAVAPPDYQFAHTQLHQAAQQLRPDLPETAVHTRIGQALWQMDPPLSPHLIVTHLNAAAPAAFTTAERIEIATLNRQASRDAHTKIAYDHAITFALHGLAWLPEDGETTARELWIALHLAGAQAATHAGAFAETDRLLGHLLTKANSVWERVEATQAQLFALYLRGQHEAAVQAALAILPQLGIRLLSGGRQSETAVRLAIGRRLAQVELALRGKPVADLAQLPPLTNRSISTAFEIMAAVTISAAATNPQLLILIGLEMAWQTIRHGRHALSALGYAIYGVFLCGVLGRIKRGYAFGQLALQTSPAIANKEYRSFISYFFHAHIAHWRDPIGDTLTPLRDLPQSGDYEYLALAAGLYPYFTWFINYQDVAITEKTIADNLYVLEPFRDTPLFYRYRMGQQYLQNLMGWSDNPARLVGDGYDASQLLPRHIAEQDRTTVFYVAAHQLILAYLYGDWVEAKRAAQLAVEYANGGMGTPLIPVIGLYDSLTQLAGSAPTLTRKQWQRVRKNQRRMARWAAHNPANCLHRHTMVSAEIARVKKQNGHARELYDLAIAQAQDFLPELALAHELAACFYVGIGQSAYAQHHAQAAQRRYQQWGAVGKVQHIAQLFADPSPKTAVSDPINLATVTDYVDGTAVLQSVRLLTEQTDFPLLLEGLAMLLKENAGAQTSYLLLPQGGDWRIATAHQTGTKIAWPVARQVAQTGELYLYNYTSDKGTDGQAASILCLPLADRGELVGLCYMENDLTGGLFQREALPTLIVLAEMAAIAIKNSLLAAELHNAHWQAEAKELAVIESERQRIAREIHDGVAQDMAFLRLKITLWRDWILTNPERMTPELDEATVTLDRTIQEIRRAIYALRPLLLEKEGLLAALTRLVADLNDQHDTYITLHLDVPHAHFPRELELPLYRVAQESLNNVIQHAQATQAWVALSAIDNGIYLMIRDNGRGFEETAVSIPSTTSRFGLQQMQERIAQAGGTFTVESQLGLGTEIQIFLSLLD